MKRSRNPFPGVARVKGRHGRPRWRYRRHGVDVYLPGPYGSPEFRAAYEAAEAMRPVRSTAARGSIAWLVEDYLASARFADLAQSSRYAQRKQFDWPREVAGDLPFGRMQTRHVKALLNRKAGPEAANGIRKRLSALFDHARRIGLMTWNPARLARRRRTGGDGFHTRTAAEVEAFRHRHPAGSKARLGLELILNTGAARQDVCRMGWQNVAGGRIRYRRGKTRVEANLPILEPLAADLAHVPRARLIFLCTDDGRPYTVASFGNLFAQCCADAGLAHCSAHGLRKATATMLAERGATEHEIAAFLAHSSPREAATYTRMARRATLGDSAMAKLTGANPERVLSNLSGGLDKSGPQAVEK